MVGLNQTRMRSVGEFSKGMQRRIGLAQALINDPDLVISGRTDRGPRSHRLPRSEGF